MTPQDYYKVIETSLAKSEFAELEQTLVQAFSKFPDDPYLWQWAGWSAERRKDWVGAEERWAKVCSLFPDDPTWLQLHVQALRRVARPEDADALLRARDYVDPDKRLANERIKTDFALAAGKTLRQIESLGSGCELGVLQREVGHEPLGLLRWTYIKPSGLLKALKMEFSGVGEASQSEVGRLTPQSDDYWFSDSEYGLGRHTFASIERNPTDVLSGMCRQMKILKRKLLEDLRQGGKIFLYKWTDTPLADVEDIIIDINRAIQTYNTNRLIFVSKSDDRNSPGTTRKINETLLFGYLGHTAAFDGATESDYAAWQSIIVSAERKFLTR